MQLENQRRILEAADKLDIMQLIYRYADGVDRGDFQAVLDCFHPDANYLMEGLDAPVPVKAFFEANAEAGSGFKETMHHTSNVLVTVDGDTAKAQTYILAHHMMKADCPDAPPVFPNTGSEYAVLVGARYIDELERRDGEWKILLRSLTFEWSAQVDETAVSGPLTTMRGSMPSALVN